MKGGDLLVIQFTEEELRKFLRMVVKNYHQNLLEMGGVLPWIDISIQDGDIETVLRMFENSNPHWAVSEQQTVRLFLV